MATKNRLRLRSQPLEQRMMLAADASWPFFLSTNTDLSSVEFRSVDGTGNNAIDDAQGAAGTRVIRFGYPAMYPDGHGDAIDVAGRPNARDISNEVHAQSESVLNDRYLTDWVFQWGQFVTHDMDLTGNGPQYNELSDGTVGDFNIYATDPNDPIGLIPFNRSDYDPTTGTPDLIDTPFGERPNWREQMNRVTSYIDASNVYGSDDARAAGLRSFVGGKLTTMANGLLPGLNDGGFNNDDPFGLGADLFLAGDVRANEHIGLTAVHSLFVREHNRLADRIADVYPDLNDEQIYQLARRIVGAEMQIITYNEFLPALLGHELAPSAADAVYSESVNASITNSFATAIFRFGHSLINENLLLVDNSGATTETVSLNGAFFNPDFLKDNPENVDLLMKGLATQLGQENDLLLTDGIRNMLFGPMGLDLAALDIERGRDHGLPDYNSLRDFYGLEKVTSFEEISSDAAIQAKLEALYGTVDNIDAFVGVLAEDHLPNSSVGALANAVMVNQFTRLRDGDRFFYANDPLLSSRTVRRIIDLEHTTLSKIIQSNTEITNIQDNVFFDSSVMVYHMPDRGLPANLTVYAGPDGVKLIDNQAGRVIKYGSLADVSQVIVVGSDLRRDSLTVDVGHAAGGLEGGVVVYGGAGGYDRLNLLGTRRADDIVVDAGVAEVNGTSVAYTGFEFMTVLPGFGHDNTQIGEDPGAHVTVFDPNAWFFHWSWRGPESAKDAHQPGNQPSGHRTRYADRAANAAPDRTAVIQTIAEPLDRSDNDVDHESGKDDREGPPEGNLDSRLANSRRARRRR